jgi:hypothetical protein
MPVESLFLVPAGGGVALRGQNAPVDSLESLLGHRDARRCWGIPPYGSHSYGTAGRVVRWLFAPNGSNWTMCDDFALIGFTVVRTRCVFGWPSKTALAGC